MLRNILKPRSSVVLQLYIHLVNTVWKKEEQYTTKQEEQDIMIRKLFGFIGRVIKSAIKVVKNFFVQTISNIEAITILGLATVGTAALLCELPFIIAMPMWIESAMVIPFISITFVLLIAWVMERRLGCCEA